MFDYSILSKLVGYTYEDPIIASSYSYDLGFNTFRFIEGSTPTIYCYIFREASQTIISVRGPNPLSLTEDDYILSSTLSSQSCKVGVLYKSAVASMYSQILDALHKYKPKEIAIIGHSVGGSIAVLLGAILLQNDLPVKNIRTYGQLRTGNVAFCNEITDLTRTKCIYSRVIAPKDIWIGYPTYPYSDTGVIELTTTSEAYKPIDNYQVIKAILDGIKASNVSLYLDHTPSNSAFSSSISL